MKKLILFLFICGTLFGQRLNVSVPTKLDITHYYTDDFHLEIIVLNADTTGFDFTGYTGRFYIKKDEIVTTSLESFGVTFTDSIIMLDEDISDLDSLRAGRDYFYHLLITNSLGNVNAWLAGKFIFTNKGRSDQVSEITLNYNDESLEIITTQSGTNFAGIVSDSMGVVRDSLLNHRTTINSKFAKSDTTGYYKRAQADAQLARKQDVIPNITDSSKYIEITDALNPAKVTVSSDYRFVTNTQISTWNAKLGNSFSGVLLGSGTTGDTPASGAGTRIMWIPSKYAFRAGTVDGTHWDDANIGSWSVAFGLNNIVSGNNSFTVGQSNNVKNYESTAFGRYNYIENPATWIMGQYDSTFGTNSRNWIFGTYSKITSTVYGGYYNWLFGQYLNVDTRGLWVFGSDNTFTSKRIPYHDQVIFWNEPLTIAISDGVTASALPSRSALSFQIFDSADSTEYKFGIQKPTGQTYSNFGLWANNDFSADESGGMNSAVKRRMFNVDNSAGQYDILFNDYKTDSYGWGNVAVSNGNFSVTNGTVDADSSIAPVHGQRVIQNASYRLVTDTEKSTWNGKFNTVDTSYANSKTLTNAQLARKQDVISNLADTAKYVETTDGIYIGTTFQKLNRASAGQELAGITKLEITSNEGAVALRMPYNTFFNVAPSSGEDYSVIRTAIVGIGDGITINSSTLSTIINPNGGNVGIGTNTMLNNSILDVNGKLRCADTMRVGNNAVYSKIAPGDANWTASSSVTLKENIKDLDVDLTKFGNVKPKEFTFKKNNFIKAFDYSTLPDTLSQSKRDSIRVKFIIDNDLEADTQSKLKHKGFLAEEFNPILGKESKEINYTEVIAVMWLKIQELEKRIEVLEKEHYGNK